MNSFGPSEFIQCEESVVPVGGCLWKQQIMAEEGWYAELNGDNFFVIRRSGALSKL
jgi:hypothetical protein